MLTWEQGRRILAAQIQTLTPSFEAFKKSLDENPPQRVHGQAIFLTGSPGVVPSALVQNLKHNKIIHSDVAILHFKTENVPRVPNFDKIKSEKLGGGFFQIIAHHGFMEEPKIGIILALAHEQGLNFKLEEASYYLGREKLSISSDPAMGRWRSNLFIFISHNSMDAASFFGIPSDQIIEVGAQLQL
jgi:KUP system potassium uptake protein